MISKRKPECKMPPSTLLEIICHSCPIQKRKERDYFESSSPSKTSSTIS